MDLQRIWKHGYTWDQPVDSESVEKWRENITQMQTLLAINIKRCFKPGYRETAFSDGGNEVYGTYIFIRWPTSDGTEIVFVAAKAFVAPLKYKTTPRLELMAAVAMVRLTKEVETTLDYPFEFKNFWTDSRVIIYWLLSLSSRYKPFVASRIQGFLDCSENYKEEIRYVPSDNNPADAYRNRFLSTTWRHGTEGITVNFYQQLGVMAQRGLLWISINNLSWHRGDCCGFLSTTWRHGTEGITVNFYQQLGVISINNLASWHRGDYCEFLLTTWRHGRGDYCEFLLTTWRHGRGDYCGFLSTT